MKRATVQHIKEAVTTHRRNARAWRDLAAQHPRSSYEFELYMDWANDQWARANKREDLLRAYEARRWAP